VVLLFLLAPSADAQITPPAAPDTAIGPIITVLDSLPYSPRGAFLRSLVLPGWGQAYVGAPVRGAVYFALASGSYLMSYVARSQLRDARREQDWLRESGQIAPDAETEFALARARHFEDWAALSIFLMFLSGADAYVSAYLVDFDEHIGVRPGEARTLRIEAKLPVTLHR
jgi:hypothetical protein